MKRQAKPKNSVVTSDSGNVTFNRESGEVASRPPHEIINEAISEKLKADESKPWYLPRFGDVYIRAGSEPENLPEGLQQMDLLTCNDDDEPRERDLGVVKLKDGRLFVGEYSTHGFTVRLFTRTSLNEWHRREIETVYRVRMISRAATSKQMRTAGEKGGLAQ